ncbi:hypothetical protein V565_119590, partial [Rhizoctonia solani 123E]
LTSTKFGKQNRKWVKLSHNHLVMQSNYSAPSKLPQLPLLPFIQYSSVMDKRRPSSSFQRDSGISPKFASGSSPLDELPRPLVAKLYWPRRERPWEDIYFTRARSFSKDSRNHLLVAGPHDIDPPGIDWDSPSPPRAPRIIIFEHLLPITDLQGDMFLIALVQIIRCHFIIWNHGFCHQNISLANLMTRFKNGRYYGLLNDWDLASRTDIGYPHKDLAGMIPYVAVRLLTARSIYPEVKRLYYHELESFFWIMIWMFLAYQDKKLHLNPDVARWQTGDPKRSQQIRITFLAMPEDYQPQEEWRSYWQMSIAATQWVYSRFRNLNQEETTGGNLKSLQSFLELVGQQLKDQMPTTPAIDVDVV